MNTSPHHDQEKDTIEKLKNIKPSVEKKEVAPEEDHEVVSWQAPEKEDYARGPSWYISVLIIMALGVLYGIYISSWTTIIVFILLTTVLFLYSNTEIKKIPVNITDQGIHIRNNFYPYKEIEKFWIIKSGEYCKLGFRENHGLRMEREVIVHKDLKKEELSHMLKHFLKEEENKKEGFVSKMSRMFKL